MKRPFDEEDFRSMQHLMKLQNELLRELYTPTPECGYEFLRDYFEGELEGEGLIAFLKHAEDCAFCSNLIDEMGEIREELEKESEAERHVQEMAQVEEKEQDKEEAGSEQEMEE